MKEIQKKNESILNVNNNKIYSKFKQIEEDIEETFQQIQIQHPKNKNIKAKKVFNLFPFPEDI